MNFNDYLLFPLSIARVDNRLCFIIALFQQMIPPAPEAPVFCAQVPRPRARVRVTLHQHDDSERWEFNLNLIIRQTAFVLPSITG